MATNLLQLRQDFQQWMREHNLAEVIVLLQVLEFEIARRGWPGFVELDSLIKQLVAFRNLEGGSGL